MFCFPSIVAIVNYGSCLHSHCMCLHRSICNDHFVPSIYCASSSVSGYVVDLSEPLSLKRKSACISMLSGFVPRPVTAFVVADNYSLQPSEQNFGLGHFFVILKFQTFYSELLDLLVIRMHVKHVRDGTTEKNLHKWPDDMDQI